MIKALKRGFLLRPENEIKFDSFTKFPRIIFQLLFFDFEQLNEEANQLQKLVHFSRKLCSLFFMILLVFCVLSSSAYSFFNLNCSFESVIIALAEILSQLVVLTKAVIAFHYKDDIRKLFEEFEEIFERRVNKDTEYGVGKYLTSYYIYMFVYFVPSMLGGLMMLKLVFSFYIYGEMGSVIKFWYPFDVNPENYPIILIFNNLAGYSFGNYLTGSDTLLFALLTVAAMEFDILKTDWMNFDYTTEGSETIKSLIDRQNRLVAIADKCQSIYSMNIFLSFVVSAYSLCSAAFQLIVLRLDFPSFAFYVMYMVMTCAQILYPCIFGQKLIDSSESIADGVYFSKWETADNGVKKDLIIVMARAQKPTKLTALGFADMSLTIASAVSPGT